MLLAKVQLLPGAVGLGILDGFALELPLVTTRAPFQGQEIAYLRDGVDGIMVDDWKDPSAYASAIVDLLGDAPRLERMRALVARLPRSTLCRPWPSTSPTGWYGRWR